MPDVPHVALPLRLTPVGRLALVEQGSIEDVASCVRVLLDTPIGSRVEVPDYGVPDLTFLTDLDMSEVRDAVGDWEPRAEIDFETLPAPPGGDGLQASILAAVTVAEGS